MKCRILAIVLAAAVVIGTGGHLQAGFQDYLRDAMKALGGGEGLTNEEVVEGLREALEIGTRNAVQAVSRTDGYFKNPPIKILLPENVRRFEDLLRATGFGRQVDAFEMSMNRAAKRAAPEARAIFWEAIKQMTFTDARAILDGLFWMLAEEEKKIRREPAARVTERLKKVFGAQ